MRQTLSQQKSLILIMARARKILNKNIIHCSLELMKYFINCILKIVKKHNKPLSKISFFIIIKKDLFML